MVVKLDMAPPGELDAVMRLRVALRRFEAASDEITRRHGLTPRQYDLLSVLHASDAARHTPSRLALDLQLGRNSLTELVSRAAEAGLVHREPHGWDGRSKRIVVSVEGTRRYLAAVSELRPERTRLLAILREAAALAEELAPR